MTNFRKKKHIMEVNSRLEKRYILEGVETGTDKEKIIKTEEDLLKVFSETIKTIKDKFPDRARACTSLYNAVQYCDVNKVERLANKCLESLDDFDRTDKTAKMLEYSKKQEAEVKTGNQKTTSEKVVQSFEIASGLLLLWNNIKQAFQKEQQR
jgi:hypothetical protein